MGDIDIQDLAKAVKEALSLRFETPLDRIDVKATVALGERSKLRIEVFLDGTDPPKEWLTFAMEILQVGVDAARSLGCDVSDVRGGFDEREVSHG